MRFRLYQQNIKMNTNNKNEKPQEPSRNMQPPINNFFHGLAQMNFFQLKFSEDLKRHYLQSQGQISMLHKMVEAERVKSQVSEDNLKKLRREKENINSLLRSACEHLREARNSHEEEKSKNDALKQELLRVKAALKAKKSQYRECHRRYKKHKAQNRQKSELLKSQSSEITEPGRPWSKLNSIGSDQSSTCDSQTTTGSQTNSVVAVDPAIQSRRSREVTKKRLRENCDPDCRPAKTIKIDPDIITV